MTDDETKAARDAMIFGTGWLLNGKHVPMEDVMADDLVKRLRAWAPLVATGHEVPAAGQSLFDAADRIEAQDKRNKELEAALREIKAMTPDPEFGTPPIENAINVARAALGEKKDGQEV